jgi:hypothetical protein
MTLKTFQKCDNKYDWMAYIRIGLYFVTKKGERQNFCDIHLGGIPKEVTQNGIFSGPKDSTKDITRLGRSQAAQKRYFLEGKVNSDLDLSAGGQAKPFVNKDTKTLDVWLFGPLLLEGVPYGSLVARLEGFEFPKATSQNKIDYTQPDDVVEKQHSDPKFQRFKLIPPKGWTLKFHPCQLLGGDYSEGSSPQPTDRASKSAPSLGKALGAARHRLSPAILPSNVTKVIWKVEDVADELTVCEIYERHG